MSNQTILEVENLKVNFLNFKELLKTIKFYKIDLVIVGPEQPLVNGIVDFLRNNRIKVLYLDVKCNGKIYNYKHKFIKF